MELVYSQTLAWFSMHEYEARKKERWCEDGEVCEENNVRFCLCGIQLQAVCLSLL
jgi:hypothetical protein